MNLQSLYEAGIVPIILIIGGSLYIAILILLNIYYVIYFLIKRLFHKPNS
ncbi:hypothetical protein AB3Z07_11650 [Metabacillus halosaccharovorans]|nr:hypothetical protein [Bacillus sp. J37]